MKLYCCIVALISSLLLGACSAGESLENNPALLPQLHDLQISKKKMTEKEITLTAVGDILIHDRVYDDAEEDGVYHFGPMLDKVLPYLNDTTITFANQETMIGGEELGLSGYPNFNSPAEIGDTLKNVGVDIVSLANNHTLDHGEEAVLRAIEHWNKIGMMYTGAYESEKDRDMIRVIKTKEGISVAFLAYTYGTNGITVPDGKDFLVNYIDIDKMKQDINKAKQQADVIVLSVHFGEEYERLPSKEQQDIAQFAADQGVDIVLGHHPHVLQPMEWLTGKNGNKTFAIYSLGNFLSGQYEHFKRIGGILKLTIRRDFSEGKESFQVVQPRFMPTYVHDQEEQNYKVLPMYDLSDKKLENAKTHYKEIKEHMSQWMPELEFIE